MAEVDGGAGPGNQVITGHGYDVRRPHTPRGLVDGRGVDDVDRDAGKGVFDDGGGEVDDASGSSDIGMHFDFRIDGGEGDSDNDSGDLLEIIFQDLLPDMPDADAELRLTEVIIRVQGLQTATNNNQLLVTEEQRQQLRDKMLAFLRASNEKVVEATAKTKDVDIWTKIKLGLEWLGAALGVAVGAALIATGAGTALGLCLISIGVISLLSAADSTTSTFSDAKMGIAAHMWVKFGVDKETADKLQLTAQILAAVAATAIAIAMFWVPGEAQAVAIAQWIQIGNTLVTVGMELVKVVGDVTVAGIKYDADSLRIKAKEDQAGAKAFEAELVPYDALVEQVLEQIAAINDRWNSMLEAIIAAIGVRNNALIRIRFTA
jgi:hypothetical protein